jgi:hypothetical protein
LSQINRIAQLLQNAITDRQVLAVGNSDAAVVQGSPGLFRTGTGMIRAIATNFCYGDCLLAKVEGTWYAINPRDNQEVVRSSVDRLIRRRAKATGSTSNVFFAFKSTIRSAVGNNYEPNYRVFWSDQNKVDLKVVCPTDLQELSVGSFPDFANDSSTLDLQTRNQFEQGDIVYIRYSNSNGNTNNIATLFYYRKSLAIEAAIALNKRYIVFVGYGNIFPVYGVDLGALSNFSRPLPVNLIAAAPEALSFESLAGYGANSSTNLQYRAGARTNTFSEIESTGIIADIPLTPLALSESPDGTGGYSLAIYSASGADLNLYPSDSITRYYQHDFNVGGINLGLRPQTAFDNNSIPLSWRVIRSYRLAEFFEGYQYDTLTNIVTPLPLSITSPDGISFVYPDAAYF